VASSLGDIQSACDVVNGQEGSACDRYWAVRAMRRFTTRWADRFGWELAISAKPTVGTGPVGSISSPIGASSGRRSGDKIDVSQPNCPIPFGLIGIPKWNIPSIFARSVTAVLPHSASNWEKWQSAAGYVRGPSLAVTSQRLLFAFFRTPDPKLS
jgi:hypothetical protein